MEEKDYNKILGFLIDHLKSDHNYDESKLNALLNEQTAIKSELEDKTSIPLSIFSIDALSALESIVKFLKENCELRYSEIGKILSRDQRSIWVTYNNAQKKFFDKLPVDGQKIPVNIFSEKSKLGVQELLVEYLHDKLNLRFSEIAVILKRDQRTVWTAYNKIKKKRGQK